MAVIFVTRPNKELGIFPIDELSEKRVSRMPIGIEGKADLRYGRNVPFHRKFFALLWLVFKNQDRYDNFEDFRCEVQLKTGHYREHVTTKGQLIYVPESISFDECDQTTFEEIYNNAIDVCLKHFCYMDEGDLRQKVNEELELRILDFS